MPNLGNILQNSLFHHVLEWLVFIFRIIILPILPLDYGTILDVLQEATPKFF
jgi:hypothetical protein